MINYDRDTVLSDQSMEFIKARKPDIYEMLSFFDSRYDRECYLLAKAVEAFHLELMIDDEFRAEYGQKFVPAGVQPQADGR